jgi:hypothetical protein
MYIYVYRKGIGEAAYFGWLCLSILFCLSSPPVCEPLLRPDNFSFLSPPPTYRHSPVSSPGSFVHVFPDFSFVKSVKVGGNLGDEVSSFV